MNNSYNSYVLSLSVLRHSDIGTNENTEKKILVSAR